MKKENWTLFLSVIAIVISIIATAIAAYRTPELGFDYQGVIVGILSLLITILIGWQIYNVIYLKKEIKEEVLKSSGQVMEKAKKELLEAQLNILYGLQDGAIRNGDINYILSTIDVIIDIVTTSLKEKVKADRILIMIEALYNILCDKSQLDNLTIDKFNKIRERIKELSTITEKAFDSYNKTKIIA